MDDHAATPPGPDAAEALYREHSDRVWRYAMRRCACADDAADVVAATFLAAVEGAHRYDPARGTAVAWLIGIAAHEVADRGRRRRSEADALEGLRGRELLAPDERDAVDARIDAVRRARGLRAAVQGLPRSERELLLLVAGDGLTTAEAARVLGIHPAAARMRLSRARRRLTAESAPAEPEPRGTTP